MVLTIDKFGRILIPKVIRQAIGINLGDELIIEIHPDKTMVKLTPKPKESDIKVTYTDWGFPQIEGGEPFPDDFNTADFIKEGYEEYHNSRFGL